jgi:hypothetical protein
MNTGLSARFSFLPPKQPTIRKTVGAVRGPVRTVVGARRVATMG